MRGSTIYLIMRFILIFFAVLTTPVTQAGSLVYKANNPNSLFLEMYPGIVQDLLLNQDNTLQAVMCLLEVKPADRSAARQRFLAQWRLTPEPFAYTSYLLKQANQTMNWDEQIAQCD